MAKNSKRAFINAVRAKGGVKYFDLGGPATLTTQPSNVAGGLKAGDPLANVPILNAGHNAASDSVGNMIQGVGQLTQGIGSAFTAQNGFQAQLAPTQQLDYSGIVNQAGQQALSGYGAGNANIANEQALAQQYLNQAAGQGPNPAQAALAQNTETNVANQAALMANQRGGSANAGLIARQAAQQGAATQQQAVGQAATLEAQQRLAAQQAAGALQGQIGNQVTNQQAAANQLFGIGAGATNTQNANQVSNYGMAQGINAGVGQQNAAEVNKTTSGLLGGISSLAALFAKGGEVKHLNVPHYADGGPVSMAGQLLSQPAKPAMMAKGGAPFTASKSKAVPGQAKVSGDSLKNDTVPAMLSPGEIVLPRHVTQAPDAPRRAAAFVQAIQAKQGLKRGKRANA